MWEIRKAKQSRRSRQLELTVTRCIHSVASPQRGAETHAGSDQRRHRCTARGSFEDPWPPTLRRSYEGAAGTGPSSERYQCSQQRKRRWKTREDHLRCLPSQRWRRRVRSILTSSWLNLDHDPLRRTKSAGWQWWTREHRRSPYHLACFMYYTGEKWYEVSSLLLQLCVYGCSVQAKDPGKNNQEKTMLPHFCWQLLVPTL